MKGVKQFIQMTGNKSLLDTSLIVHAFRRNNEVSEKLDTIEEVYVSVTVAGELYYGAYKSKNPLKHLKQMKSFLDNCKILQIDTTTAETYGIIKALLAKKGAMIPENDIWIGATAIQYKLPLYTTDTHFNQIDGIILI